MSILLLVVNQFGQSQPMQKCSINEGAMTFFSDQFQEFIKSAFGEVLELWLRKQISVLLIARGEAYYHFLLFFNFGNCAMLIEPFFPIGLFVLNFSTAIFAIIDYLIQLNIRGMIIHISEFIIIYSRQGRLNMLS
ncbi:hypothetical protein FGO68_gene2424 [Halteria grandinella]|uniref:Uncharacterized protein n=1 Tax=Halteria grandinella TaxID=5974 RepID=A0A8J8T0W1_HALGN|nr:hypothetical protein FGO68_gene2424 [Halteria grandinella]